MKILFGVTGGIAAYKTPTILSSLRKRGHDVEVVVTAASLQFVTEMSLSVMSGHRVISSLASEIEGLVTHIEKAQWCDVFTVCPATANFIGKMACGIADDVLSTIHLALPAAKDKRICPAMNAVMWENGIVRCNVECLEGMGYEFLEPEIGALACGGEGRGVLPSTKTVVRFIEEGAE